jgi:hypothetical protein
MDLVDEVVNHHMYMLIDRQKGSIEIQISFDRI